MSDFVEKLRLAEKAAEDIYFAKVNRELIEALHQRMQAEADSARPAAPSGAGTRGISPETASAGHARHPALHKTGRHS